MTNCCNQDEYIRDMMFGLDALVELDNHRMVPALNLDNAATTPPFKQVVHEIQRQLRYYGSIGRGKGQKSAHSTEVYVKGREIVKRFVGANSDLYTVFYVNSTTEGMNKLASALIESPDDMVLTTRMEHHADDLPWRERARTVYAEVDADGRLIVSDIERLLTENAGNIKYVAVTAVSNVTGYVNDVHQIAALAHRHGAQIIVDGAQMIAHRPFSMLGSVPEQNIDFLVFSAHKMYSPFGGGAVVGLKSVLDAHVPEFYGGGMVAAVCDNSVSYLPAPDRYEAGSPDYPGVVGMLESMKVLRRIGFDYIREHEYRLMRRALYGLKQIPEVVLYGDNENILDRVGIIVFNIQGIAGEAVADYLSGHRAIAVRHGAFCAHPYVRRLTREVETTPCAAPSGMVRVSFSIYNSERDVDCLIQAIRSLLCNQHHVQIMSAVSNAAPIQGVPYDRA